MPVKTGVSKQTQRNWLVDASLFTSALLAMISGIYFLFLPVGGFQGGRNPAYNLTIIFSRHTWDDLHTWSGVLMITAVVVHLSLHWQWVVSMTRRTIKQIMGKGSNLNARGRFNLWINILVAAGFLITAVSGVYFLFVPGGNNTPDPLFLLTRQTWDMLHTWGAVVLILAAGLHFVIHWNWVVKVTRSISSGIYRPTRQPQPVKTISPSR